jgi:hypothetical protein
MNDSILVRFEREYLSDIQPMKFQFRPLVGEDICYERRSYRIYRIEHVDTGTCQIYAKEIDG